MRILLSNDDGILAPGLAALYAAVRDLGDVAVVAPASAQSAAGHSITLAQLGVQRLHVDGPVPFAGISVDGRPADCVRLAILKLLDAPPDLVLSGINAGANVGSHVFYSGTGAAAAEGCMLGVPAVAFSAAVEPLDDATAGGGGMTDFRAAARHCRRVLDRLLAGGLRAGDLINVNVPMLGPGRPRGQRAVRQSDAELKDVYEREPGAPGESYRITSSAFDASEADTDIGALADGYVTVTPLHVDRTDHAKLAELRRTEWKEPA